MTQGKHCKIIFTPSGRQGVVKVGVNLLQAARQIGVDIDSVCGGRAMCGRCQIDVAEGVFDKHGVSSSRAHLSKPTITETRYADKRNLVQGRRLACQCEVVDDLVIDVPAASQMHQQLIRKAADNRHVDVNPPSRLCFIEVREPDMHEPSGDLRRIAEALMEQWPERMSVSSSADVTADLFVLKQVQATLRKANWQVTVVLRDGIHIAAVMPGLKTQILGVAIDIGSTTMSAQICDMNSGEILAASGMMNPQIRFGEDLMSRVSYGFMNKGGADELTKAVQDGLQQLIETAAVKQDLDVQDIFEIVLVGNPVMHHLVLGIDPVELGGAPFALTFDTAFNCTAHEIGLSLNVATRVYVLPCIAGHVGADAAGAVLAEAPHNSEAMTLLIDVGTNAEIILGNRDHLMAASSPTGPAFEGAQISAGQRAAVGAIERVRINPNSYEPRFKVIGSDNWSDSLEFQEDVKKTGITGICGSGIIEILAEMYLSGIISEDGVINGELSSQTKRIEKTGRTFQYKVTDQIAITQTDVRAIQLAKAALYAGFRLLMDKMGVEKVDKIMLAGAFGTHIDPKYAMILGMVPDCALDNVIAAGNSAGAGARMALLSLTARAEIEKTVRHIEKIETAIEPSFQDHFVRAMAFPHKTDPYFFLSAEIKLPPRELIDNTVSASSHTERKRTGRRTRLNQT
ncbi:MAG: ASKHA domain-containing protein [Alphaproteobacteria bacterium]|nr:ASKHA domain-containing protein [Alphaproteobacteria bacterium]